MTAEAESKTYHLDGTTKLAAEMESRRFKLELEQMTKEMKEQEQRFIDWRNRMATVHHTNVSRILKEGGVTEVGEQHSIRVDPTTFAVTVTDRTPPDAPAEPTPVKVVDGGAKPKPKPKPKPKRRRTAKPKPKPNK